MESALAIQRRLRIFVVSGQELLDRGDEGGHRVEAAAAQPLVGQVAERAPLTGLVGYQPLAAGSASLRSRSMLCMTWEWRTLSAQGRILKCLHWPIMRFMFRIQLPPPLRSFVCPVS
jgi:hypothetical protein